MKEPKPLPRIQCPYCHLSQQWNGQKACLHCGKPMPDAGVAQQLTRPPWN